MNPRVVLRFKIVKMLLAHKFTANSHEDFRKCVDEMEKTICGNGQDVAATKEPGEKLPH